MVVILDEVTFLIRLLSDNWASAGTQLVSDGVIEASNNATPKFIDVRSIEPKEGRRVDIDAQSVVVVYEDSSSTTILLLIMLLEMKHLPLQYTLEYYIVGILQTTLNLGIDYKHCIESHDTFLRTTLFALL